MRPPLGAHRLSDLDPPRITADLADAQVLASALAAQQFVSRGPGDLAARLRLGREAATLAGALADEALELGSRRLLIGEQLQHDPVTAGTEIAALETFAAHTRRPLARWYALLFQGIRATMRGRYEEALIHAADMEALGQRIDAQPTTTYAVAQRLQVLRDLGRGPEAEGTLRDVCARCSPRRRREGCTEGTRRRGRHRRRRRPGRARHDPRVDGAVRVIADGHSLTARRGV